MVERCQVLAAVLAIGVLIAVLFAVGTQAPAGTGAARTTALSTSQAAR